MRNLIRSISILFGAMVFLPSDTKLAYGELTAGAAVVDITPIQLPVIVNGGFIERQTDRISDPLHVRCLVLNDGREKIALVVADSCMIPRDVCDKIKMLAGTDTGIPVNRILVAATHTHSAPSLMDYCLGSRRDKVYTELFVSKVAKCIVLANSRLQPAHAGWVMTTAPQHTFCRRWIRHPQHIDLDPFGEQTVRAMMHPGYENAEYLGPAGPVDKGLGLLSVRTTDGQPICILANYSMHYVGGVNGLSADYWGHFAKDMNMRVMNSRKSQSSAANFVVMMSQGTSGDLHWMDYSQPSKTTTPAKYAQELSSIAFQAYENIVYQDDVDLSMADFKMTLDRRRPSASRLAWARKLNAARGDRRPQSRPEVYAEQAVWIHEHPREEVVLQAIRIGELGITAIPNEVFGVTGLKIKAQSPLRMTFNMELANGAAGYIPPPEQHELGGYTTWPARTAGLEVNAEPKIVDRLLDLLEQVSGKPRRSITTDLYPESIRVNIRRALSPK